MSQIQLQQIYKSFQDKKILNDMNLSIEEGEMISLLGPSGCGKTTTLKIIAGLMEPDQGDILINNQSVLNIPVEKRGAVIVFQDYLLFPHLTVEGNIEFGLKMAKVDKKIRKEKVKEMLSLMELDGQQHKYPNELSGGQRQRVALARALAVEPKVLLLDEPFSNLDLRLRETMREFVCSIQRKLKITTILVTHDKDEALMTSDKIAIMLEGEIKQYGTPLELYKKPISEEVANFFGETNYIIGKVEDGIFKSPLGNFRTTLQNTVKLKAMIRPEEIEVVPEYQEANTKGIITRSRYAGDRMHYRISLKGMEIKSISTAKEIFDVGEEVSLRIDSKSMIFYEI
ncbi:ABC transporter related [Alkaliphilus metalliredigens QYMF]|uniref:ABC-type quaternary amine transporter n=1 Tax=Alkaliphilus metalliredigens (strain QYMF) TaxID=293826 RepID=A6TTA5_ALKMQ|nr:ABC transporter ATP-binding protein [Alkaliphilus metalliredigens]ABR49423.1 ABC transporter related [Alkaliphilus metalliredigens QYMF]